MPNEKAAIKNALITASTKGIGRAIAIALAKEGVNLAICSRHGDDLAGFKDELIKLRPQVKVFTAVCDCSIKQQLLQFAADAEKELGFISVVVNNAGIYRQGSILDDQPEIFQQQIDTNIMPAYELYRYFGKTMMAAKEGQIYNICSAAAIDPIAAAGTYSVTKYALLGLTKVMRKEMQPHGVKVTAVIPGSTLTDSWKDAAVDQNKMILPEDVASAVISIYKMSAGANVDEIIIKPAYGQL